MLVLMELAVVASSEVVMMDDVGALNVIIEATVSGSVMGIRWLIWRTTRSRRRP